MARTMVVQGRGAARGRPTAGDGEVGSFVVRVLMNLLERFELFGSLSVPPFGYHVDILERFELFLIAGSLGLPHEYHLINLDPL